MNLGSVKVNGNVLNDQKKSLVWKKNLSTLIKWYSKC